MTRTAFDEASALIEQALSGDTRRRIVSAVATAAPLSAALARARHGMLANTWTAGGVTLDLSAGIASLDRAMRARGFHALHDWDGKAGRVNPDPIAVDVLDLLIDHRGTEPVDPKAVALLLDYYFLYLLALLSLDAFYRDDRDSALDRLTYLVQLLQSEQGSGQRFADDAGTLMLVATSHYSADDDAFDRLLEEARLLDVSHRTAVALQHAASLGSHLRYGFEATYGRDVGNMRDDNIVDYRWLCFSLAVLVEEFARIQERGQSGERRDRIVEAIFNGLSVDADAFLTERPPSVLAGCEADRRIVRDGVHAHKRALIDEWTRLQPAPDAYSPLSLFFNFAQNVLKGAVVDALLTGEIGTVTLNDLHSSHPAAQETFDPRLVLATTLMNYARDKPDMVRGRLRPMIVYDPANGREAFVRAMRTIRNV